MGPTLLLSSPLCHPLITSLPRAALPRRERGDAPFQDRPPVLPLTCTVFLTCGGVFSSELGALSLVTSPSPVKREEKTKSKKMRIEKGVNK